MISQRQDHLTTGVQRPSTDTLIECISIVLKQILQQMSRKRIKHTSVFSAKNIPSISILNYLKRINSYAKCSQECFILGLIYIDRVTKLNKSVSLNEYSLHR